MGRSGPNRVLDPTNSVAEARPMSSSRGYVVPSRRFYDCPQASPRASNSSFSVNRHSSQCFEVTSKQATKVTAISTSLEWRIEQFDKLMKLYKNGHNLVSDQFSSIHASSVVWELHVYPNGKREEDAGFVSFFLRQVGSLLGEEAIMAEFQIYTNDKDGTRISLCRDTKDFVNQQGRGKFQVQPKKLLNALKTDLSLLLICELEYFPPDAKITTAHADECENLDDVEDRQEFSFRTAMKNMFDSERFADCIMMVDQKEFRVHRCILAQHSEVFRSMFSQSSVVEVQKGVINITDCHSEPVRAMLEFIYTGTTNLILPDGESSYNSEKQYAQDVLTVADKYAILSLKEQCERFLAHWIDAESVASMVVFADRHTAHILRVACIRFIMVNQRDIIRSTEWKQLKRDRPDLTYSVLEAILIGDFEDDSTYDTTSVTDTSLESPGTSRQNNLRASPDRKRLKWTPAG
ncbi:hypothetical protein L596_005093 [Steinernema carpocapsae]|uniref:BTB domain-containing protein n=1 Tax=Steinernema carpocapsae TaxID=34508 RepID=A0A4U8V244_STECR|nr:hypothetical protein L596_005093 [Steinernema carpocapsae]